MGAFPAYPSHIGGWQLDASRKLRTVSVIIMRRASRRLLSSPSVKPGGFFELRTDKILPGKLINYVGHHSYMAAQERASKPGWLGSWKTELGSSTHKVSSLYHWSSYDERDAAFPEGDYTPSPMQDALESSSSVVMLEATAALQSCGLPGAAGYPPASVTEADTSTTRVAWELRQYQLVLGYPTVPKFLELYTDGLRDKLSADDSGASTLVSLLYSDNGPLNVVIELWRHESMQRAQESRVASRQAEKWKSAIGEIANLSTDFRTEYMRPLPESPWQ